MTKWQLGSKPEDVWVEFEDLAVIARFGFTKEELE